MDPRTAPTARIARPRPAVRPLSARKRTRMVVVPDACDYDALRRAWPAPRPRTVPWSYLVETARLIESL